MNDYGKTEFDSIPIPAELSRTVSAAVRKGICHRIAKNIVSLSLTVVLFLGISANVPVIYAYASQVPMLGNVVRMMRVGSGGTAKEQVSGTLIGDGRKVYFQFTDSLGKNSIIPQYSVKQLKYPYGMVLHLHNVAQIDQQQLWAELERIPGVKRVYPLVLSNYRDVGVTVLLEERSSCVISELDSGVLEIGFLPREPAGPKTGYLLCSPSMAPGPELIALHEALSWEGGFQLPESAGYYRIALGPYASEEQALKVQEGIRNVRGVTLQIMPIASRKEG